MITNRNLGVITDNFHMFWWIIIFSRDILERMKRELNCQKATKLSRNEICTRRHGTEVEDRQLRGGADRTHPCAA
jgi:hypothetical protein